MNSDTDQIFMEELKQEFMESVAGNLVEMSSMLAAADFESIARIAHDIKGTAGIFGLDRGTDIAKDLQYAAQEKDAEKTGTLLAQLTRYMKDEGIVE